MVTTARKTDEFNNAVIEMQRKQAISEKRYDPMVVDAKRSGDAVDMLEEVCSMAFIEKLLTEPVKLPDGREIRLRLEEL